MTSQTERRVPRWLLALLVVYIVRASFYWWITTVGRDAA
jgi:hypothetical protein